ncbi:MAG: Acetyltransferase family [Lachnospiraceae bacterium]|nr:Acetyltransferase family [Lachnospiraceae bacterium]MDF2952639.1 Acetyltransferase family [Anaerocolumna sp.]
MNYKIVRVNTGNYSKFSDLVHWRMTGKQRHATDYAPSDEIKTELANANLYIYAIEVEDKFVGWISLIYLPKVGKFNGHGHIYVDELWMEPSFRNNGLAKVLMAKADGVAKELKATGIRLYVNEENPIAQKLYKNCGYTASCTAYMMQK